MNSKCLRCFAGYRVLASPHPRRRDDGKHGNPAVPVGVSSSAPAQDRGGHALDHDVDAGRLAAGERALAAPAPARRALRHELAMAAQRRRDEIVARGQQLAAVRAARRRTRAAGSGTRRSRSRRCRPRRRRAGRSARPCRTRPCGSRTCRRPARRSPGRVGSASRAAMANGIDAPIEPATPLMMRRAGGEHGLRPLRELAAVADEHGIRVAARRCGSDGAAQLRPDAPWPGWRLRGRAHAGGR